MRPLVVCLLTGGYGIRPYGFCFYLLSFTFSYSIVKLAFAGMHAAQSPSFFRVPKPSHR